MIHFRRSNSPVLALLPARKARLTQALGSARPRPRMFALGLICLLLGFASAQADQNPVQVPTGSPLPGLTLVNDVNSAFKSLATIFSGASAPTTALCDQNTGCTTAGWLWHDTGTNRIMVRDQADANWIPLFGIDETSKVASAAAPVLSASSSQTISASNHYPNIVLAASASLSLAQAGTLWNGFQFTLYAQGGNVTLAPYAADSINGGTAGASLVVPTGYAATLVTNAGAPGTWSVAMERMALGNCSVASASTVDLGAQGCPALNITGNTTITGFGATAQAGQVFFVTLAGTPQLTYDATAMILNTGGANYTASAGDRLIVKTLGGGNFEVTIIPASGQPPNGGGAPIALYTSLKLSVTSSAGLLVTANSLTLWNSSNQAYTAGATTLSIYTSGASSCTVGTVNCLDTDTLTASTWYYVYAIGNGATVAGLLSASASAPTLPLGYTYTQRLGAVRVNASSSLVATIQHGRIAQYVLGGVGLTSESSMAMATGTASWPTAVAVGGFVPPTASRICLFFGGENSTSQYIVASPNNHYGGAGATYGPLFEIFGGSSTAASSSVWMTLESTSVYWGDTSSVNVASIMTCGWEDNL